jgi:uncharacterized protein (DUF305 family)
MITIRTFFAAALTAAVFILPASGQTADFKLPKQCAAASTMGGMDDHSMGHGDDAPEPMTDMMGMGDMDLAAMPEHVQENMRRMMISMPAMHEGMMLEDADVAFACGMIAHHQGAIDMAEVLMAHGDDPKMRALAEEIIDAQVGEIAEMTAWLAQNAK